MDEEWRAVKDYEKIYEVSDMGRVRTTEGKVTYTQGKKRVWKQRILKLKSDKNGYKRVTLWKNNKAKDFLVHRLVAYSFIKIKKNKFFVNHIDGNPSNNTVSNLEWCDAKENVNHAFVNDLMTTHKSIVLVNKDNKASYFNSMAKASQFLGKNDGFISGVLKRNISKICGYKIFVNSSDFLDGD